MNGLPIFKRSRKKNLNLEIFSTDIVEYISIDKVYGGSIYGDLREITLILSQRTIKEMVF
jgi:hypothetical protein